MSVYVRETVDHFYFGGANGRLFGALHAADTYAQREYGFVICYPFGQEYIRAHRACRQLALRLAQAGYPVLRFDYFGTGDSEGDAESIDMAAYRDDIAAAIDVLYDRSGVDSICLAGLRLGASLALEVASENLDVSALILWEPIVDGAAYLAELANQHQELLWRFFDDHDRLAASMAAEFLGFPVGQALRAELERLNLLGCLPRQVSHALVVERKPDPGTTQLRNLLVSDGVDVKYRHIPSFATWQEDVDKGLVPDQVLRSMVTWVEEELP